MGGGPRSLVGRFAVGALIFYRTFLSPLHPPACRFYPSCSAYAMEGYRVYGFWKATRLTVFRLLRCHPFHPGGYDPLPHPAGRFLASRGEPSD
ncbi:MAG: membrane protein insertion efficiency factor YidD [Deltaproteobacteria bacterium]|nr:membrane protein insertion efficiency factor YidD [Deltaproteobacteria bacterium]